MVFGMAVPAFIAVWMTGFGLLVNMWFLAVALSRLVYQLWVTVSQERDLGSYELLEKLGAGGIGEV